MASVKISHGIRVEVKTTFVEEYSDISAGNTSTAINPHHE